ncbi:PREDICTED: uncharacterized protein LOC109581939 isoform X2 [Amphimedon queenslandica]|uniref:Uncharacterized protein n=1 Tax=Amphimedon queenslandica TaxID=400682 RepID=A0AAN0J5I5_AMPQE|nr:PREDICTED: uncharacterized protein LOC109581939 isoform X2 [Amphimedon queenslandica]|eukprot:XP_019852006.1 PREDICTED: uncharacterized protein LOC109581939 isoform X2 [Amphimedon queenslandica]
MIRQKESMEDYVKYIEELFLSIKTSHKEFMRDLYHKIDFPLKDLTAHYYHLKASNSSLEILESYIYETVKANIRERLRVIIRCIQ